MACEKCGRPGDCGTCCCVHPDHRRDLPGVSECRLCGHEVTLGKYGTR